jgi:hypothetical protein
MARPCAARVDLERRDDFQLSSVWNCRHFDLLPDVAAAQEICQADRNSDAAEFE